MIYLLTLLIAATRFLPHPPNMVCLGALGLFAGCYVAGRRAYLIPVAVLLISDFVGHLLAVPGMGFYSPMVMLGTYLGITLTVPLGRWARVRGENGTDFFQHARWKRLPIATFAASTGFFLISNFAVWLGPWYPSTATGLVACFVNAIPFYGYTLAGDFFFVTVMFGAFELSQSPRLQFTPTTPQQKLAQ